MTTLRPPSSPLRSRLRGTTRILIKEIGAFGLVGAIAFVMNFAIYYWLAPHGSLKANAVSVVVSTTFAYFGNRFLSFSHRARTNMGRETLFFFGINLVTLVFTELALGLFHYSFGFGHASRVLLAVNVVATLLGTVFRFWAYKRFVFLHPDRVHDKDPDLDTELAE